MSRLYSEQEASEILQRAAKLQESDEAGPMYSAGVTEDELRRIAKEAGIDPRHLDNALTNASAPEKVENSSPFVREYERVIDGELEPEDFDLVVDGLKTQSTQYKGQGLQQIGRKISGTVWNKNNTAQIEVTSRHGRTRIKVRSNAFLPLFATLHPSFVIGMISLASLAEAGNPGISAAVGLGLLGAAGVVGKMWLAAAHRQTKKLADELAERTAQVIAEQARHREKAKAEAEAPVTTADQIRQNLRG